MKTLIFAEKPSVGKDIARILGASKRGDGFLEGEEYIVTWGFGHLVALAHPEDQNPEWKKWRLESLPMLPREWKLMALPSSRNQLNVVSQLFNRQDIDLIVNGADAGREGELIFRLVYQYSGCSKPCKRLWISSMTDEAIKAGFSDLRPGFKYDPLARAAECRSRADWLVGMNLTRAYTKKLNSMFTLGRVQTPTLAMVVARHLEIQNFVAKDYWEVNARFCDFSAIWFDPKRKEFPSRLDSLEEAEDLCQRVQGRNVTVSSAKKTSKKQTPPSLYDLTTLQREANSKYSMTAAETLAILQGLYEKKKVVTYPRTDSRHLSDDIFPTIEKRLAALPSHYDEYLRYLRDNRPKKDKKVFNNAKVSDHHAVIPTEKKVADMSAWSQAEKNIYDMVVRRFLAVFYSDHEYLSTTLVLKSGKDNFKATGKVVTEEGWRVLYPRKTQAGGSNDEEEADQSLPPVKKGDERVIEKTDLQTKKTKPPAAFTESTLLQAMETAGKLVDDEELRDAMKDSGLGTPATRAEIIEKLIRVEYMVREKKKLIPTDKGVKLISVATSEIKSPELTGSWERRLSLMARDKEDEAQFMGDIENFVSEVIGKIKNSRLTLNSPPEQSSVQRVERKVFGQCPACGKGQIIEGNRGFGCNRFREGCNYVVWKEFFGKKLTQASIDSLIAGKSTRLLKGFILDDGQVVSGRLRISDDRSKIILDAES